MGLLEKSRSRLNAKIRKNFFFFLKINENTIKPKNQTKGESAKKKIFEIWKNMFNEVNGSFQGNCW